MSSIRVLPPAVASRVAAGEVVERPASIVKELVENAFDAGARAISVEWEDGGKRLLSVVDDGAGMAADEVELAFEHHATSKIRSDADLEAIGTFGFRGEALPSIASVADVSVWTRPARDDTGTFLRVRGGQAEGPRPCGTPEGTRLEVRDLFWNTPARRKFLRAAGTESGHVSRALAQLALARPDVALRASTQGREVWSFPADDLRYRIRKICGEDVGEKMEEASVVADGDVRVRAFLSHPHVRRPNGRGIHFFVNGRPVRDKTLQHALLSAYATLLPRGAYPAAVVYLDLPKGGVDVNVHPMKLEVRFRDSREVHDALRSAVRGVFGRPAAGVAAGSGDAPPAGATRWAATRGGLALAPSSGPDRRFDAPRVADAGSLLPERGPFGSLRVLGQLFRGYVVCEGDGEVVLVDQHAAAERVAFERLRRERGSRPIARQRLLVPETIELGESEVASLLEWRSALDEVGIELEAFGDRALVVRSVPAIFGARSVAALLEAVAGDLAEDAGARALDATIDKLMATIACHSVVRVGQELAPPEIRRLLDDMGETPFGATCPHGRPVTATMDRRRFERLFGR